MVVKGVRFGTEESVRVILQEYGLEFEPKLLSDPIYFSLAWGKCANDAEARKQLQFYTGRDIGTSSGQESL